MSMMHSLATGYADGVAMGAVRALRDADTTTAAWVRHARALEREVAALRAQVASERTARAEAEAALLRVTGLA